ncbi:MAG: hypothetical protein WDN01_14045 [Rhizomicrobium sp.]
MKSNSSVFPANAAGVGLLVLRLSNALLLLAGSAYLDTFPAWTRLGFAALAFTLGIGFCTKIAAAFCAAVMATVAVDIGGRLGFVVGFHAATAAALAMLGGGAYSVDGRLFGRRIIRLER